MPVNTEQCGTSPGNGPMSPEVGPPGELSKKKLFKICKVQTQASLLDERLGSLDQNLSSCGLPPLLPEPEATGTT